MKQQYTTTAIKKQLNNKNNTTATSNINNMVIVITLKKSNSQIKKLKLKKPSYTVFTDTNPQLDRTAGELSYARKKSRHKNGYVPG